MPPFYTLRPAARRELDEITDHIAVHILDAAIRLFDAAQAAIKQLAAMLGMRPPPPCPRPSLHANLL